MKIFSTSDRIQNILTIQLKYDELEPLNTHRNILSSTVNLVNNVTLDYSLDNIYPQIRQLIKPMEKSKNIMLSGMTSSASKREMTPYQLLFFIDFEGNKSTLEIDLSYYYNLTDLFIKHLQPNIPYLEKLELQGNSKMSSESMKYISDVLMQSIEENNKYNLDVINISYCDLTDQHIEYLQPCIPYLESLNISGNKRISSKSMEYISDVLIRTFETHHSCDLKGLEIRYCHLTDKHLEYLHPCIPYFENLNIGSNREMSSKSMEYICYVIMKNMEINKFCNLKVMEISNCDLTDEHVKCLHNCIPYIENLILSGNGKMSFISMKYISDALMNVIKEEIDTSKACKLQRIDLSFCNLTDQHIEYLQPCIPYLENLSISGNTFVSFQGMKYISDALIQVKNSCNLKVLNVSHCDLYDNAIDMMEPCFPYLKQFVINGNYLSDSSKELILDKLGIALK